MNPEALFAQVWDRHLSDVRIHPADDMLSHLVDALGRHPVTAYGEYLLTGAEISAVLRQVMEWLGLTHSRAPTVLDYAAGYGRTTRHLVRWLPPDRIWVSDIRAVAADYQRSTFGVRTIPAAAHPRELRAPHRFDVVSAISLLTHVPPHTFGEWLRAFFTLLQPGGAFLFTTHDLRLGPHRNDADRVCVCPL